MDCVEIKRKRVYITLGEQRMGGNESNKSGNQRCGECVCEEHDIVSGV
jgi:hypothetical protein